MVEMQSAVTWRVGQNHIYTCMCGILGREITKYTDIYGATYTVLANPSYQ